MDVMIVIDRAESIALDRSMDENVKSISDK